MSTYKRIHGKNGVTSLHMRRGQGDTTLYSSGRDGFIRTWEVRGNELIMTSCVKIFTDWIAQCLWRGNQMWVTGFQSVSSWPCQTDFG